MSEAVEGGSADLYAVLAAEFGASVPVEPLETIASRLTHPGAPAGTTDRLLAEGRPERSLQRVSHALAARSVDNPG